MSTNFKNLSISKFNAIKWTTNLLAFITPLILTIFTDNYIREIVLPCLIVLLPFLSEISFKMFKGFYFKNKLKNIILKEIKIDAVGMYILPTFRHSPNEDNKKVQSSEKYQITIKIFFNFWKANVKIKGATIINKEKSSTFTSINSEVWIDTDNSIKIRYMYDYDYIDTPEHKTKFIADFNGICSLHFDSEGKLIDYYYSSDGKNRFSFVKEWGLNNE